jgi:hypothetical protein
MKTCFWNNIYAENLKIMEEYDVKVGGKMHKLLKIHKLSLIQEF